MEREEQIWLTSDLLKIFYFELLLYFSIPSRPPGSCSLFVLLCRLYGKRMG